jgi:hypothetical protein
MSSLMNSHDTLLHPTWDVNHLFAQPICYQPVSPILALQLSDQLSIYVNAYVQITLTLLNNGPKVQE